MNLIQKNIDILSNMFCEWNKNILQYFALRLNLSLFLLLVKTEFYNNLPDYALIGKKFRPLRTKNF